MENEQNIGVAGHETELVPGEEIVGSQEEIIEKGGGEDNVFDYPEQGLFRVKVFEAKGGSKWPRDEQGRPILP